MQFETIIAIIGFCASLSSILFAFLAFRRSDKQDRRNEGKSEGLILSDVGYIKACVDRMESNLSKMDERYRDIAERLAKAEENIQNTQKRVDEIYEKGG